MTNGRDKRESEVEQMMLLIGPTGQVGARVARMLAGREGMRAYRDIP